MWFDLAVVGVLVLASLRGAKKGFVWQLAVIGAIVLCFALAETLSPPIARHIPADPPLDRWIAMFVLYLASAFVAFSAARVIGGWIDKLKFTEFDRHLGAIFGLLKGAVFCLVLTFFVVTLSADAREVVMNSRTGWAAAIVMDRLHPVMPRELHEVLEPYIHQLDRPGMDLKHAHDHQHAHDHEHEGDNGGGGRRRTHRDDPGDEHAGAADPLPEMHGEPPTLDAAETASLRLGLLEDIAAVFADYPDARRTIVEEIEITLVGVPDQVAAAVLQDWYADLLTGEVDPDPDTTLATSLDERIIRQLQRAGISLDSLSSRLRERLAGSRN